MNLEPTPSGHYVTTRINLVPYQAFVPDPLPPELNIDLALVNRIDRAGRSIGELAGLGRNLPDPSLLTGSFVRKEAVLSSRIEGTVSELSDLMAYEAVARANPSGSHQQSNQDVREVYRYVQALEFGLAQLPNRPLDLALLCDLHRVLMEGSIPPGRRPGCFRESQNFIGRSINPDDAIYIPPPVPEMHLGLKQLEPFIQSGRDYPPLLRLAFIHYQFEAIHPFEDGNGRVGRLLLNLLLIQWNILPAPLLALSEYFESNRQTYYELLNAVSREGRWYEWVVYFLDAVITQADDAVRRIKLILEFQDSMRQKLSEGHAPASVRRLAEQLLKQPILTIPQAQEMADVSYPAAQKSVAWLVKAGILAEAGPATYARRYAASKLLSILSDSPQ